MRELMAVRLANRDPIAEIARDLDITLGTARNMAIEPEVKRLVEHEKSLILRRHRKRRDARGHRLELLADRAIDRLQEYLDPKNKADTKTVLAAAKMVLDRTNPVGLKVEHSVDLSGLGSAEKIARLIEIAAAHPAVIAGHPELKAAVLALTTGARVEDVVDGEVADEESGDGDAADSTEDSDG